MVDKKIKGRIFQVRGCDMKVVKLPSTGRTVEIERGL